MTPEQVEAGLRSNGLEATAIRTGSGYIEIKTEPIGLQPAPVASAAPSASPRARPARAPRPAPSASPASRASAVRTAAPVRPRRPRPHRPPPSASASAASASPGASPSPSPVRRPPVGNTELPTGRQARRDGRRRSRTRLGPIESQASLTTIGAVVSSDLLRQALILIVVGSLGIVAWITYRFRDVKFGVTALVSLLHDVIVVVGAFAILGTFFHVEIDALFVTAMLTVIGFSVHDTIVVFDRIRENKARHLGEPFDRDRQPLDPADVRAVDHDQPDRGDHAARAVPVRRAAISDFILALLIGIVIGTYSSIFVASPLLVDWTAWEDRRHGRLAAARAPRTRRAAP